MTAVSSENFTAINLELFAYLKCLVNQSPTLGLLNVSDHSQFPAIRRYLKARKKIMSKNNSFFAAETL